MEKIKNLPAEIEKQSSLDMKKGRLGLKYKKIAFLASKGLKTPDIAEAVGLSEDRVYKILSSRQDVWDQANQFVFDSYKESERGMVDLLQKTVKTLEDQLLTGSPEDKRFAVDRILKFFQTKSDEKGRPIIAQFITGQVQQSEGGEKPKSIDEMILEMRKQRGLPPHPTDIEEWE